MAHLMNQTIKLAKVLTRKKRDEGDVTSSEPKLARVLGLADLTFLGVGSTLGVGVYVLAGAVARTNAGPAVTLSFLVAAIASAFAGLCYAEFAARVPKAGSAYVYSYVTVGELAAFIIGWNLILEYVIGTASVARALSNYIDNLAGNVMQSALKEALPINVSFLSPYPDFLSCGVVLILSMLLAWGVKESTALNNCFTVVNLLTVLTVIVAGSFFVDFTNWSIPKSSIPSTVENPGNGGFLPFGITGVMAGAAKCFYGFVGFDCVATTGEEAKNPKKDIPLAIIMSLIIIFLAYFSIATVLTLMLPYYEQDVMAPIVYVFEKVGLNYIRYMVSVGAIFALCTSMLGGMFPLPRVLYAMSIDGLLYNWLSLIHPGTSTPVLATLSSGVFSGIMAAIFDLDQLIDMMSIGTLLAYTIVAICVLILRYRDPEPVVFDHPMMERQNGVPKPEIIETAGSLRTVFNLNMNKYPNKSTETVAIWAIFAFIATVIVFCITLVQLEDSLGDGMAWAIITVAVIGAVALIIVFVLCRQPQSQAKLSFKVPCLPMLPCLSILMNFYLMAKLDLHTWIRFGIWLFIGMLVYIFYSIPHSVEGIKDKMAKQERTKHFNINATSEDIKL
uniref:Cationic amino acid transporter C-terminal domain-containing protein n=1 Tax=Clastoptera arizonana TaxID=38151 RepID=A0A1B6DYI8_9HEMI